MNENQKNFIQKLIMGVLMPIMLFCIVMLMGESKTIDTDFQQLTKPTLEKEQDRTLTVLFGTEKRQMDLDTYLLGVVLGEMPASFEMDALRAQAVAARTYTLKKCLSGQRHGENTICTDHTCCQAYKDPEAYLSDGGSKASVKRVQKAVKDTTGEVLVYEGELIMATYFSCAGGQTENAVAVWGQEYPYLQSVPSPGEEEAAYFTDSKSFTAEEFQKALGIRLEGKVEKWFGKPTYTDGGGVDTLPVCGIPYRGTTLRTLLGLRSTAFSVSVSDGKIIFRTRGYGHRVGMSQYGANAMAKEGKSYREILMHYYTGAEIVHYTDENTK